jgi:branched-chain amino acid transport system substrate-binding protein
MSQPGEFLDRRRFLRLAVAAGVAPVVLAACGTQDDTAAPPAGPAPAPSPAPTPAPSLGPPLKIGFLAATSGVFATVGKQMLDGLNMYIDQQGGVLAGRPVQIIVEDTEANPEVGVRRAQKLVDQDGVDFVTGIVSSAVAVGVRDYFHEGDVPLIISNGNVTALSRGLISPKIHRTSSSFAQYGSAPGQWFYDNVAKDGVIVMTSDFVGGRDYAAAFKTRFEAAGGQILEEVFTPFQTTSDYQPFLSNARAKNPNAIMAFYGGGEGVNFANQYSDFGLIDSVPLYALGALTDETVLPAIGAKALGVKTHAFYTFGLDTPGNADFVGEYESRFGEVPTYFSVGSYDAAHLIDVVLQKVDGNTEDTDSLLAALDDPGALYSPGGFFEMDAKTNNAVRQFHMREVVEEDGKIINKVIADLGVHADPGE